MTAYPQPPAYPPTPTWQPAQPASPQPAQRPRGDWSLSWHGVRTVATLELTQRLRSTRWKIALLVWFIVVGGICLLISLTTGAMSIMTAAEGGEDLSSQAMFGITVMFILSMGLLLTPTLSSAAINGDRIAGTLAILQVTLLTPIEITLGKLLAGWLASLTFLVISVPFIIWSLALGGVSVWSALGTITLLALVLGVVSAISLGLSAVVTKPTGSTVLAYLTVTGLCFISLLVFTLAIIPVTQQETFTVQQASRWDYDTGEVIECEWKTTTESVTHTERIWWLLAINPYVIVADATAHEDKWSTNPLASIRDGVRYARAGASTPHSNCPASISGVEESGPSTAPVWPLGLAINLLLGAGAVVVTVRRLRIPQGKLARGTRVA